MRFKDKVNDNIDPKYYKTLAMIESSGNPNAKAKTSSAAGLYQFTKGTWKSMVEQMGLKYSLDDRFDPTKSRKVVEEFTKRNYQYLKGKLNREVSPPELYLAHFLGMGGSQNLLRAYDENPNLSAAKVVGAAQLAANKSVFYNKDGTIKKVKDIYNWASKKFGVEPKEPVVTDNRPKHTVAPKPDAGVDIPYFKPEHTVAEAPVDPIYSAEAVPFVNIPPSEKEEEEPEVAAAKESIDSSQNKMDLLQKIMTMNQVQYINPQENLPEPNSYGYPTGEFPLK